MRLLLVMGLIIGALPSLVKTYGADVSGLISALNQEFGESFSLANNDPNQFKFQSASGKHTVWYIPSKKVFEAGELSVFKVCVDYLDQSNEVYHLLVGEHVYLLHLNKETARLKVPSRTPKNHIQLIKAWVAIFNDQLTFNALVVQGE